MASAISEAIRNGLKPGGDLASAIQELGDVSVTTAEDAQAICDAIETLPTEPPDASTMPGSPLHAVLGLMQSVETRTAYDTIRNRGIPKLISIVDGLMAADGDDLDRQGLVLFALKVLVLYQVPEVIDRIAQAARHPDWQDAMLWDVVFRSMGEGHPFGPALCGALSDPPPKGLLGLAFLDFANTLAKAETIDHHPFDSSSGRTFLRDQLHQTEPSTDESVWARSAAMTLPYLSPPDRDQLLETAMNHPDTTVQMEAARSAVLLGREDGIKTLARMCLDVNHSLQARLYLQELDHHDAVPPRAAEPNFEAMAKMVDWLQHPLEFGRPPDEIGLLDTRELLWPPANDVRQLWIFRFRYTERAGQADQDQIGVGMVGSITFSLFGETHPDMPPEDIYALHCCWELQVENDPRAPANRTVEAGRKMLGL